MTTLNHWIGGQHAAPSGSSTTPIHDPATGEILKYAPAATAEEVETAIDWAQTGASTWATAPASTRSSVLFSFREKLIGARSRLAEAITGEQGKVLADAMGEVDRGLEVVELACGAARQVSEVSMQAARGLDVFTHRQPIGVVLGITPFNFPVMIPLWMSAMAIATGNSFILKPAKRDPSASLILAELWAEAGLPAGVFQVLHGGSSLAQALITHPAVSAVSFVGSTGVAQAVHASASASGKRVQAFGSAKNYGVVLPDADLGFAAKSIAAAAFGAAGQRCMALPVALLHEDIADEVIAELVNQATKIKVGPGRAEGVDLGPLISRASLERVRHLIGTAVSEGAETLVDGRTLVIDGHEDGYFVGPTILDRVHPAMEIHREEVFAPVLEIIRFSDLDEAISIVNANPYGNGTAIFTSSGFAARRYQMEIEVGMVGINVPIPVPIAAHSFGGWKGSVIGDVNMYGADGLRFYTRLKTVTQRWPDSAQRAGDASYHFAARSKS
ncbi:MAG: CoA-acylating methylmalonate-semialdehyde dehydrogenase [Actinobacteria bacterium]|nr:CoA-acylating methylmalonate-semialdehyde dehydrogenase [Actinomycetota bacterium]